MLPLMCTFQAQVPRGLTDVFKRRCAEEGAGALRRKREALRCRPQQTRVVVRLKAFHLFMTLRVCVQFPDAGDAGGDRRLQAARAEEGLGRPRRQRRRWWRRQ